MADQINPGDIIICHRSGWWRVLGEDTKINYYGGSPTGRILVELAMDKSGRIPKRNPRTISVHKSWCQKLTPELIKEFKEKENKKWNTLMFIVDPDSRIKDGEISEDAEIISKPEPEYLSKIGPPQSLKKI